MPVSRDLVLARQQPVTDMWNNHSTVDEIAAATGYTAHHVRKILRDSVGSSKRTDMDTTGWIRKTGVRVGHMSAGLLTIDEAIRLSKMYPSLTLVEALVTDWRGARE
jgi:predicted transcriptional regulator